MMKKPSIHSVIKNMLSHFGCSTVATTDLTCASLPNRLFGSGRSRGLDFVNFSPSPVLFFDDRIFHGFNQVTRNVSDNLQDPEQKGSTTSVDIPRLGSVTRE
jgi:hypothetical protein